MAANKAYKVGIIIGSARVVRVAPQIASFVLGTIQTSTSAKNNSNITFDMVDLKSENLPMFDEGVIPAYIQPPDGYQHEHTRQWSRRIAALDAFVFVASQRNHGYPSELKNAVDYLFNEWKGKPAMIVTYGGHGGHQSGDQLRQVLGAIGMRLVEQKVGLKYPDREFAGKGLKGQELGLDASSDSTAWAEQRPEITSAWEDLVKKLSEEA